MSLLDDLGDFLSSWCQDSFDMALKLDLNNSTFDSPAATAMHEQGLVHSHNKLVPNLPLVATCNLCATSDAPMDRMQKSPGVNVV